MSRSTTFTRFMEREWLKTRPEPKPETKPAEKEPEHGSREIAR